MRKTRPSRLSERMSTSDNARRRPRQAQQGYSERKWSGGHGRGLGQAGKGSGAGVHAEGGTFEARLPCELRATSEQASERDGQGKSMPALLSGNGTAERAEMCRAEKDCVEKVDKEGERRGKKRRS